MLPSKVAYCLFGTLLTLLGHSPMTQILSAGAAATTSIWYKLLGILSFDTMMLRHSVNSRGNEKYRKVKHRINKLSFLELMS